MKKLLLLSILLLVATVMFGKSILFSWNFSGNNASNGNNFVNATNQSSFLNNFDGTAGAIQIKRGPGLIAGALSNSFAASFAGSNTNPDYTAAIANDSYYVIPFQGNAVNYTQLLGYKMKIRRFDADNAKFATITKAKWVLVIGDDSNQISTSSEQKALGAAAVDIVDDASGDGLYYSLELGANDLSAVIPPGKNAELRLYLYGNTTYSYLDGITTKIPVFGLGRAQVPAAATQDCHLQIYGKFLTGTEYTAAQSRTPFTINYTSSVFTKNEAITTLSPSKNGNVFPAVTVNQVTTLYGNNTAGDANGPTATDVRFRAPMGITTDRDGNFYIMEDDNLSKRIRKITPFGEVSVFAGPATGGGTGTVDGTGTAARFTTPLDAAIHPTTGDLYVIDGNRIRKITSAGVVTSFAGATNNAAGYVDGAPDDARFRYLVSIAFDKAGNIYVTDRDNNCIRKYTASTGLFTTLAGLGSSTANATKGYADGMGADAKFDQPIQLVLDASDNIYLTERGASNRIRKITPDGLVSTIAGNGTAVFKDGNGTAAGFNAPWGITIADDGSLYIAGYSENRIRKIDIDNNVTTIAGNGAAGLVDGIGTNAQVPTVAGMVLGKNGNLYFVSRSGSLRMLVLGGYTISPTLPAGLKFNSETGDITGIPTETSPQTTYTINAYNGNGELEATATLELSVQEGPLPVKLVAYNVAKNTDGTVSLSWKTSSENNSCYFVLQKSSNGIHFEEIYKTASLSATGASYSYTDKEPHVGINYYKLVQEDCNAVKEELGIKTVVADVSSSNNWKVYPNPVTDRICSVHLPLLPAGHAQIVNIYGIDGTLWYSKNLKADNNNIITVKLPEKIVAGSYLIEVKGLGTKKILVK